MLLVDVPSGNASTEGVDVIGETGRRRRLRKLYCLYGCWNFLFSPERGGEFFELSAIWERLFVCCEE